MLFADATEATQAVTLTGVIVTLAGIVAWVLKSALPALLKQYRDDVFRLADDFRAEIRLFCERQDREMAKRDAVIEKVAGAVDKLADELSDLKRTKQEG